MEKVADRAPGLKWVTQLDFQVESVAVAATHPNTFEDVGCLKLGDDPLRGPFGDSDRECHVA